MKYLGKIQILFVIGLLMGCSSNHSEFTDSRPREVWVFRSVLDQRPRMLTAALNEKLWLSYDTQSATLYKAWSGGVTFDGAVYTTKHGPQPTSTGYAYFSHKEMWVLMKNGKEIIPEIEYKGHRFDNGEVFFKSNFKTPEGEIIFVEESPRYEKKGKQNGLARLFALNNPTTYKVGLKTVITSLEEESDFSTDGNFDQTNREVISFDQGKIIEIGGILNLKNGRTELSILFHPGFDKYGGNTIETNSDEEIKNTGIGLIAQNDCVACHNTTEKTVGPSYISIAKKYGDDDGTVQRLAKRIKIGGSGVWGQSIMTPHPDLERNVLEDMVKYILTLDDNTESDSTGKSKKYTLAEASKALRFSSETEKTKGSGLVANLYLRDPTDQGNNFTESPTENGITPVIHVLNTKDFDGHTSNFKILFHGEIAIQKEDSYVFRLICDDGAHLYIDDKLVIDNGGAHAFRPIDGEVYLNKGKHSLKVEFVQKGGDAAVSLQWFDKESNKFKVVPENVLTHSPSDFIKSIALPPSLPVTIKMPGDQASLTDVHPSFTLYDMRPDDFEPRVGGMDFKQDGTLVLTTWDADGSVYSIKNYLSENSNEIEVKRIAAGLAEPLGIKVVDDEIYVLQKQELTQLIDHNGDEIIDEYKTISYDWNVSSNFHEFAFGLAFKDGHFYATLATAILPGGASADPQITDRGKVMKISRLNGSVEFIASGLRTPNGIGLNNKEEIFVSDNQGDWLPASKIVHIKRGEFYGSRSVDFEGTKNLNEKLPIVWVPQDEIGNSPSEPTYLNIGPYKNQLIYGEVTHGGIKRVAYEEVEGELQGTVFRFTQGLEAGVNRLVWAPDGSLVVGGIGVSGNWRHYGKLNHGLQRLKFNGTSTFEMLRINALSNGFEIEFTEPLSQNVDLNENLFEIETWYYLPTREYGGPKLGRKTLKPSTLRLSKDRKKIFLSLDGLDIKHLVYFHLSPEIINDSGRKLWSTEAWYTLNRIPVEKFIDNTNY